MADQDVQCAVGGGLKMSHSRLRLPNSLDCSWIAEQSSACGDFYTMLRSLRFHNALMLHLSLV